VRWWGVKRETGAGSEAVTVRDKGARAVTLPSVSRAKAEFVAHFVKWNEILEIRRTQRAKLQKQMQMKTIFKIEQQIESKAACGENLSNDSQRSLEGHILQKQNINNG
jgi:hypothetical protein